MEELDRHSNIDNLKFNGTDEENAVSTDGSCDDSAAACADAASAHKAGKGARTKQPGTGAASTGSPVKRAATVSDKHISSAADGAGDGGEEDENVPAVSRKVRRRRRRSRPRSKTIAMKRLTREELRKGALMYPPVEVPRPRTRAECVVETRPCPWVACKHHLYLDVNPITGSIKINFPDLEPWELPETCALDVAERGGITLEEVGDIMNLTRERIRQVEVRGLGKLRAASPSPEELGARIGMEDEC